MSINIYTITTGTNQVNATKNGNKIIIQKKKNLRNKETKKKYVDNRYTRCDHSKEQWGYSSGLSLPPNP